MINFVLKLDSEMNDWVVCPLEIVNTKFTLNLASSTYVGGVLGIETLKYGYVANTRSLDPKTLTTDEIEFQGDTDEINEHLEPDIKLNIPMHISKFIVNFNAHGLEFSDYKILQQ